MNTTLLSRLGSMIIIPVIMFACATTVTETEKKESSPLVSFVKEADPKFSYEVVHSAKQEGYTYYVVRMISQEWLTTDLVDENLWWHWVSMVVPDNYTYNTGMMWIDGGTKDDPVPTEPDGLILHVAKTTGSVVAKIHNIPFQPVTYKGDTLDKRYEDAIIAYGWRKFMEGGARDEDAYWLLRLPMTNAVVLGMDVVQKVVKDKGHREIANFVVGGASKRGWTTWTTAIADERVVAITPVVIDVLNLLPSFRHHWRNYGFWAPAVSEYEQEGIMDWMGSEEFDRLLQITEPYSYKEKLSLPKLLINASGDQFFQPDSWKFYYHTLPGEKHLMYVPNSGHDVSETDALSNLTSFYLSVLEDTPRPAYTWEIKGESFSITTDLKTPPQSLKLWQAPNDSTRDFRIDVLGPKWTSTEIPLSNNGRYEVSLAIPEKGWTGYFVEITYPGKLPLKVTTGIEVLPREYPFEPFVSNAPKGKRGAL